MQLTYDGKNVQQYKIFKYVHVYRSMCPKFYFYILMFEEFSVGF